MGKVAKNTIMIMVITILCKFIGFGREIVLGSIYGFNDYGGIYLAVVNIPDIIFALVGTCIMTTFIPLHYDIEQEQGLTKAKEFLNNVVTITIIISTIIAVISLIFTEDIVKLFAMGLEGKNLDIAIKFTRILIPGGFFISIAGIINAYLNINNDFITPACISIPFNIIVITTIIVSSKTSPYIMIIGTMLGMISKFLLQVIVAYKKGYRYKFTLNLSDEYLYKMIKLSAPILIGVAVSQINSVADKSIATTLGLESVSALSYANRLNGFVIGVFTASLISVIYPRLSEFLVNENKEGFIDIITKSINSMVIFIIPISLGSIVLSKPIVRILFERGQFNEQATHMTAIALSCYSIGMIGYALRDILGKIFYSLKDTKTPMINGVFAVILNIALNIVLSKKLGYAGLALATSISSILCITLLFIKLKNKTGYFGEDKILNTVVKSTIASIVMACIVILVYVYMQKLVHQDILSVSISILVGSSIYMILIYILKVREVSFIIDIINKLKIKMLKLCK